mgnify:CR=1 FL=1
MKLTELVSITGKPGLYRVINRNANGIVVESLEDRKRKFPVRSNLQVALLDKITIFSKGVEELFLGDILDRMFEKYGAEIPVSAKSSGRELREFMEEVAPEYDNERVYASDIKKMLKWYHLLMRHLTEEELKTPFTQVGANEDSEAEAENKEKDARDRPAGEEEDTSQA